MALATFDEDGFRADLAAIADNDYPTPRLVKFPFNWFVPQSGGIIQGVFGPNVFGTTEATLLGTKNGNAILVHMRCGVQPAAGPPVVTDSQGNTYECIAQTTVENFGGSAVFIALGIVGGSLTVTINPPAGTGYLNCSFQAIEIGGVTSASAGINATGNIQPGQLGITFGAVLTVSEPITSWTDSQAGWTEFQKQIGNWGGYAFLYTSFVKPVATFAANNDPYVTPSAGENEWALVTLTGNFVPNTGGIPSPITSIPITGGGCNLLALVSEAIDEQGVYQQSALIGQQAASGFIRLNGAGPWIPISFASPLTPGYVTTTDTFSDTPIVGTGFAAIEAPFHQIDWQPAQPVYYDTPEPPNSPAGYLLAFVGLNLGVGGQVGAGSGSTHAIPSAAGPVERLKRAGIFL